MKKAKHKFIENTIVEFKKQKDDFGDSCIFIKFESGETSTMSEKRFNELFEIIKKKK